MARAGEPIERIIAKRLTAASIRQLRPIPHRVVAVLRLVDLLAESCQLMANRRHLTRGIIGAAHCGCKSRGHSVGLDGLSSTIPVGVSRIYFFNVPLKIGPSFGIL